MEFQKLPVEVINNIMSYKYGKPEYMKIKHNHNETLKRRQRRYKIDKTDIERETKHCNNLDGDKVKRQICQYYVSRKVPLSIESIEDIVMKEGDEIDSLIDKYVGYESYKAIIIVDIILCVRFHHFNYFEDDEYSSYGFDFHSGRHLMGSIDQDNITDVMEYAVATICRNIDNERNTMNIVGVKHIRFILIIDEPE